MVVNTASASGPFIARAFPPGTHRDHRDRQRARVSRGEFAEYFVAAFADAVADRDKDERVSILEASTMPGARCGALRERKRLLTEHALLDDNGDGVGSSTRRARSTRRRARQPFLEQPPALALGASPALVAMIERKKDLERSISAQAATRHAGSRRLLRRSKNC